MGTHLVKLDSNGNILWQKTSSDGVSPLRIGVFGNYIYLAVLNYINAGEPAIYIFKLDSLGNTIWVKTVSHNNYLIEPETASCDSSGNFIVAGYDDASILGFILKINPNGGLLWERTWTQLSMAGGPVVGSTDRLKLATDQSGNIFVAGSDKDSSSTNPNDRDAWLMKIDPSGNRVSERLWGGDTEIYSTYEGGFGVTASSLGSAFMVGSVTCPPYSTKPINHTYGTYQGTVADTSYQLSNGTLAIQNIQGIYGTPSGGRSCNSIESFLVKFD